MGLPTDCAAQLSIRQLRSRRHGNRVHQARRPAIKEWMQRLYRYQIDSATRRKSSPYAKLYPPAHVPLELPPRHSHFDQQPNPRPFRCTLVPTFAGARAFSQNLGNIAKTRYPW